MWVIFNVCILISIHISCLLVLNLSVFSRNNFVFIFYMHLMYTVAYDYFNALVIFVYRIVLPPPPSWANNQSHPAVARLGLSWSI